MAAEPSKTILQLLGAYDNLSEPEPVANRPETIIGLALSFLIVTWICVSFRIYTRFYIIYAPWWDDLFVVLVLLSGTVGCICESFGTRHGMGKHFILLDPDDMRIYLRYFYIANGTYCMSTALVKLSLLFQYLRIFERGSRSRVFTQLMITITALWGLSYSFMAWVPCFPVSKYWNITLHGTCYAFGSLVPDAFYGTYLSSAAINMTLDVIVLSIPIPLYWAKNTPFRSRMGLLGLFLMGGLITMISIWRLATIIAHRAATWPTFDPTWYGPISIELATLEVNFASICASMPVFWPVLTARIDKIFVTQEVKIERVHRFETVDDSIELQREVSGRGHGSEAEAETGEGPGGGSLHSRVGSEASLNRTTSGQHAGSKQGHYMDEYIAAQVDPLRSLGKTESEVTAQPVARKPSRSRLRPSVRPR